MARFYHEKKQHTSRKTLLSLAIFAVFLILFYLGINSVSGSTDRRQKETLENAITRDITWCYAVEGAYPESLEYLKEHYGLTYDENRFFIDYRILGANILPDVTIIELKDGKPVTGKGAD